MPTESPSFEVEGTFNVTGRPSPVLLGRVLGGQVGVGDILSLDQDETDAELVVAALEFGPDPLSDRFGLVVRGSLANDVRPGHRLVVRGDGVVESPRSKAALVAEICGELGLEIRPLGPGSTVSKQFLLDVARAIEVGVDETSPLLEIARAIVRSAGLLPLSLDAGPQVLTARDMQQLLVAVRLLRPRVGPEADGGRFLRSVGHPVDDDAQFAAQLDPDAFALFADIEGIVREKGFEPVASGQGAVRFDLGWWLPECFVICEIKGGAYGRGALEQGLMQLLETRHRISNRVGSDVKGVLALPWTIEPLERAALEDADITVLAPETLRRDLEPVLWHRRPRDVSSRSPQRA